MTRINESYEIGSDNVFADLELEGSEELMVKAKLLQQVGDLIKSSSLTQKEVAFRLGISQPKVSMLINGKLSAFSTEALLHYLYLLGCSVQIKVKKPRVNRNIFEHKGHIAVC